MQCIWSIDDSAEIHHRNNACELPANLRVTTLPAYIPELNPAKKFCDIEKATICNTAWPNLETLEDKITVMICIYWDDANRVMSLLTKSYLSSEIYDLKKPVSRSFKLNGVI